MSGCLDCLSCLADLFCQKVIIVEGEVRGAVAAEHPPASVSAGFGLAASRRGRLCCCNFKERLENRNDGFGPLREAII